MPLFTFPIFNSQCRKEMSRRAYDLIIFGASGFTGKEVVKYLFKNYENKYRVGIAGRNKQVYHVVFSLSIPPLTLLLFLPRPVHFILSSNLLVPPTS